MYKNNIKLQRMLTLSKKKMSIDSLHVNHIAGFFSCCTVILDVILDYFNKNKKCPKSVNTTHSFYWHKTQEEFANNIDIKSKYFETDNTKQIPYIKDICITNEDTQQQFTDFDKLNYQDVKPFIEKYFSPSQEIKYIIHFMERKYEIDYNNTCVLFYRGNDKAKEMILPKYESFIERGKTLEKEYPNIFYDEIRYMSNNPKTTVDRVYAHLNPIMSKNFLAITYIMSRCKYVVCGTGNCSYWIALFRGHSNNMLQV